jgi:hypothetical protein
MTGVIHEGHRRRLLRRLLLRPILRSPTQRRCVTHRTPRKRKAREEGTPTCRFASVRPHEASTSAAVACDIPPSEERSRLSASRPSHVLVTIPASSLLCGKKRSGYEKPAVSASWSGARSDAPCAHSFPETSPCVPPPESGPKASPQKRAARAWRPLFPCGSSKRCFVLRLGGEVLCLLRPLHTPPKGSTPRTSVTGLRGQTAERSCCHSRCRGKVATVGS